MKIGVIGGGVVGFATARAFMEFAEVRLHDVVKEKSTHALAETLDSDLVFICLPTPQKEGSLECDLSAIEQFFSTVGNTCLGEQINFVLRSTVPIGTTRKFRKEYGLTNLVHSPEFLTARCAVTDAQCPARNIIGSPQFYDPGDGDEYTGSCARQLRDLYAVRFPGIPIHLMTSDESEAVKLIQNGFFSVKVSYFNEVNLLCEKLGLDWDRVLAGVLSDGRIAHSHTQVPGQDGHHGFGGNCLPKDLASLVHQLQQNGLEDFVTDGARRRNQMDRQRGDCKEPLPNTISAMIEPYSSCCQVPAHQELVHKVNNGRLLVSAVQSFDKSCEPVWDEGSIRWVCGCSR